MQIAELRIENFRGISSGRVRFGQHTVLVGPNNCGKTTIIEALTLLFGRDRMIRSLTEHDFFGGDPQPADRISLVATVVGFQGNDPADHPEWFRDDRGIPKWWDPILGRVSPTRDSLDWQLACQIGLSARFDRPALEVETVRYFHDDDAMGDVFLEEARIGVPSRLIRDVGFFLVPAHRTWDRIVSFGSELFRRIVAAAEGQPSEAVIGERDRLRTPMQALETDANLSPIVTRFNTELKGFFRSGPQLQLRLTTTDSEGLLEAVVPHYSRPDMPLGLPARRHGSGLLSLQHLLLLLQFGHHRAAANEGFWMALEEPELHVPPPLQRRLVHRIQALSTQTFVSTHSPMVAAMADPMSVVILQNNGGVLSATPLLTDPLPAAATNGIRKLFQLNRIETISALTHDVVLIPEGRIDYDWLRILARAVDLGQGWLNDQESKFSTYVGLVPTHDAAVEATTAALIPLNPRVSALVDGDTAGRGYARALSQADPRAETILRWPDGWTIEDVVGWILEADEARSIEALNEAIMPPPPSIAALVDRLKSEDRAAHGLKQDQIAYEAVVDVIGSINGTRNRARELLNAMSDVLLGGDSRLFAAEADNPTIRLLQP